MKARHLALAVVLLLTLVARAWIIRHFPDPDTDARGHLGIAHALLEHPLNVSIHWVYLPAYHYVLAAFEALGFSGDAIRFVNCALAMLVPIFVLKYEKSTMAALFCAVSPMVNSLGTSAQQETMFVLLVVGAVWSLDVRKFALAGALLAIASLVRYEAWGAVALLVACQIAGRRRAWFPLVVTVPSLLAIGAWLLAHKLYEGEWFGFLRELYRYTHVQRASLHRDPKADALWFPIEQPFFVFGWVVVALFFAGIRRAWRPSWVLPLGIYAFLQGAYFCKGALGSARYYESLVPFVAIAAAHGVRVIGAKRAWVTSSVFAVAFMQLLMISARTLPWSWPRVHAHIIRDAVAAIHS